jgi:hypothetical protein
VLAGVSARCRSCDGGRGDVAAIKEMGGNGGEVVVRVRRLGLSADHGHKSVCDALAKCAGLESRAEHDVSHSSFWWSEQFGVSRFPSFPLQLFAPTPRQNFAIFCTCLSAKQKNK